jgi:hypothetical protein
VSYSVRSEQLLIEQIDYDLLFRWFVGLGMDDAVWNRSGLIAAAMVTHADGYLFTTLSKQTEAEEIVAWYRKRWNLELDLRTLKGTLRLKHLPGKSKAVVEEELLVAVAAYGLVRALMREAAERVGLHRRELSFTRAHELLNAMTGKLCSTDAEQRQQAYDRLLTYISQAKLPKRSKGRTYPRAVWGSGKYYPGDSRLAQNCKVSNIGLKAPAPSAESNCNCSARHTASRHWERWARGISYAETRTCFVSESFPKTHPSNLFVAIVR